MGLYSRRIVMLWEKLNTRWSTKMNLILKLVIKDIKIKHAILQNSQPNKFKQEPKDKTY